MQRAAVGRRGFSLAEAMLAMLFICIAFFAYLSLHIRLIHSNAKLEARQVVKEQVSQDLVGKLKLARKGEATTVATSVPEGGFGPYYNSSSSPSSSSKTYPNEGQSAGVTAYRDTEKTQQPTGLPPGLALVESRMEWTDKNGKQLYYVDCYERRALTRW